MSTAALSAVFGLGPDVAGTRRLVLLVLADYADPEGYSYPKKRTICRRAGIKREETVREALVWLEAEGYITREVKGWAGMNGSIPADVRPNLYRLVRARLNGNDSPRSGETLSPRSGETRLPAIRGDKNRHVEPPVEPDTPNPLASEGAMDGAGAAVLGEQASLELDDTPARRERQRSDPFRGNEVMAAAFARWWEAYPNKTAKDAARKAWAEVMADGITLAQLVDAVDAYRTSIRCYQDAYAVDPPLMHPATFLRGKWRRYEDGPDPDAWRPPVGARPVSGAPATMPKTAEERAADDFEAWLADQQTATHGDHR